MTQERRTVGPRREGDREGNELSTHDSLHTQGGR